MNTIPAPTSQAQEEWPDTDFDLPDGDLLSAASYADSDKEDEDWDIEMDLGNTGGATAQLVVESKIAKPGSASKGMVTIRPPLIVDNLQSLEEGENDDDEGVSTIKVSALPIVPRKLAISRSPTDEDIEAAFALPSDLKQLSLRPLSLNHRASKNSLEWGDKDHTSSSTSSSDTYSSLGLGLDVSPSTNSTSASTPCSDDDDDDEEMEGLIIPSGLFESDQGRKQLARILEMKRKMPKVDEQVVVASPDPEDDFEIGLIINDDDDLSPSKLLQTVNQQSKRAGTLTTRSKSMPARPPASIRPSSRLRNDRPKSDSPAVSLLPRPTSRTGATSPFPTRLNHPPRQQALRSLPSAPASSSSFVPTASSSATYKGGSLRSQKSHSGLKSPSPPSSVQRQLSRKASLSSLIEAGNAQASGSGVASGSGIPHGYNAPTAASRARTHTHSTSRLHFLEHAVPPSRPSTPSSNPVAIRLTMPTSSSRLKHRPPISSVFPMPTPSIPYPAPSPLLRPSTPKSAGPSRPSSAIPVSAKVLRRTKRRTYGDGTELDAFEDLPTDRDKEARYRVQPKGLQNRVPGGSYPKTDKDSTKGTIRRKREISGENLDPSAVQPFSAFSSLRHKQQRVDYAQKPESTKKKRLQSSPPAHGQTKRKPTLIRNLGGAGAPKVVGEMRWNPQTLRWEGNDHVLRDFDAAVGTSTRPALITHLTGSSLGSPIGSFGSAARIVGNMVFDPARMCWMSTLPPEEDEPDVFADMADDEEEGDGWETKGGTIRANQHTISVNVVSDNSAGTSSGRMDAASPTCSHTRTLSESGSDRGSRAFIVCDVDDRFLDTCRKAEARHRTEMKGWAPEPGGSAEPDRSSLYDIRALATRQY